MIQLIGYGIISLGMVRGIAALRNQMAFWKQFEKTSAESDSVLEGRIAILSPCKGVDTDFVTTLFGLMNQDHPDYELVFIVESESDPAASEIQKRIAENRGSCRAKRIELVVAGLAVDRGQKVHNLLAGIKRVSDEARTFAFVDSDVCPEESWLRQLTGPLKDSAIGATTGFRWYVPEHGSFATSLASLWNAMSVTLVGGKYFAWGGSTAIRRETFDTARVEDHWQGSISDDLGLSSAIKKLGLPIVFVPSCLVASIHEFTLASFWEFITRQSIIARIYSPFVWRVATASMLLNVSALVLSFALPFEAGAASIGFIYALNIALGAIRYENARSIFPKHRKQIETTRFALLLAGPLVWIINLASLLVAATRRTIVWRGIRYELVSPTKVVISQPVGKMNK